ncbi:MAG: hypothetical protein WC479_12595 [Candidatus Izemoplasmatales bacterium]
MKVLKVCETGHLIRVNKAQKKCPKCGMFKLTEYKQESVFHAHIGDPCEICGYSARQEEELRK